jgi:Integrase core domain/Homeodomain-like domain
MLLLTQERRFSMEALWVGQRAHLRHLLPLHPDWTTQQLADAVGCSPSMVCKWRRRFAQASPDDVSVLFSRSRAPHHHPPRIDEEIQERIRQIRQEPPEGLQRTPGPVAILYYLQRDEAALATGKRLPRSTRTIWRILDAAGLIVRDPVRKHAAQEPPEPLEEVQLDFKDVSTAAPDWHDPDAKRAHLIETCNFVDAGTSIWLDAQVREDFHAETAFQAVVAFLQRYGCPKILTFDRDPRWVGSATARDFPSALCQFLSCVGVYPNVLPPHHPELNAYVERFHRTYKEECLLIHRPSTLEETRTVTQDFQQHYNEQRPHQGRSCGNRPPRQAFPILPPLPPLPSWVDPDAWLQAIHGRTYARRVKSDGYVNIDGTGYYVKQALAGQHLLLRVNAAERCLEVLQGETLIKVLPIKGLQGKSMPLQDYIALMQERARSQERQRLRELHQRLLQAR